MKFLVIVFIVLFLPHSEAWAAKKSGLPIPRWVSMKSDEVNVRTGPGTRYPIQWVYRRDDLPVEILDEFDLWRKIRDSEGATGWVHSTMVKGVRTVMVTSKEAQILRAEPKSNARPIIKAEPTVIGKLVECHYDWCRIQIQKYKGWIEKSVLWGVYPHEGKNPAQ